MDKTEMMTLYHGGLAENSTLKNIDVFRYAKKQQKPGREYGGFYMTADVESAANYARMNNSEFVGEFVIDPDAKILDLGDDGRVMRIKTKDLHKYLDEGYDLLTGTCLEREYVLPNKEVVKEFQLYKLKAVTKSEQQSTEVGAEI
jgi:hypothetical protein